MPWQNLLHHCCQLLWLAVVLAANVKNRTRCICLRMLAEHQNGFYVALPSCFGDNGICAQNIARWCIASRNAMRNFHRTFFVNIKKLTLHYIITCCWKSGFTLMSLQPLPARSLLLLSLRTTHVCTHGGEGRLSPSPSLIWDYCLIWCCLAIEWSNNACGESMGDKQMQRSAFQMTAYIGKVTAVTSFPACTRLLSASTTNSVKILISLVVVLCVRRRRRRSKMTSACQCLYARILYSKIQLLILISNKL